MANCLGCKFFLPDTKNRNLGLCRRHPAQWTNDKRGWEFPVMMITGWCGEHGERDPKVKEGA